MQRTDILDLSENGPEFLTRSGRDSDNASDVREVVSGIKRRTLRAQPAWSDGSLQTSDSEDQNQGSLSRRRRMPSRSGRSHGDTLREACGRGDLERPNFNINVPSNGYAWWYVDGLSSDGKFAISLIGFIGSVFSPWYKWSGRKNPANHCCLNVALYGKGARWTMTDRGVSALKQSEDTLTIGPSAMHWDGDKLVIHVNEISTPHGNRIEGTVTIRPTAITPSELPLAQDGSHIWRPFAPTSDIEVNLKRPGWNWSGHGYLDANFGTSALEDDFSYWTWARLPLAQGTACLYDANRRDGSTLAAGYSFAPDGSATELELPPKARLSSSLWALRRETRADAGYQPKQVKHMLDAPFYNRAAIKTKINGEESIGVHEALDLNRYASPWLKPMLAVRVPRRSQWKS